MSNLMELIYQDVKDSVKEFFSPLVTAWQCVNSRRP